MTPPKRQRATPAAKPAPKRAAKQPAPDRPGLNQRVPLHPTTMPGKGQP